MATEEKDVVEDAEEVLEEKKEAPEEKTVFPKKLYYSADGRYWIDVGKSRVMKSVKQVRLGLTQLGAEIHRIQRIHIKSAGTTLAKGQSFAGFVGASAGGLDLPISGTIIESNLNLLRSPGLIYTDPYNSGWIALIKPSKLAGEIKQFRKVTSKKFKKFLEDRLKEERGKRKQPYKARDYSTAPVSPAIHGPWT